MVPPEQMVADLEQKSDVELGHIVSGSFELSDAIVGANPSMSQDAGFELFDVGWAKRYWKSIVSQVSGIANDKVYGWALGTTIAELTRLIVIHYSLPPLALPAAVALALILLRAAKESNKSGLS